jgi:carbamoyl-phosphate synthase small subunit
MDGVLVLEDGHWFRGTLFGAEPGTAGGEVVFNTSFTGYQEILTDPSYVGQIVTLTYPHIGNYGVNAQDVESTRVRAAGLVVRDLNPSPSSWRADEALDSYLRTAGVPGLSGLDTRALTLHLRQGGVRRGVIRKLDAGASDLPLAGRIGEGDANGLQPLCEQARAVADMAGCDLAQRVTTAAAYEVGEANARLRVVALDFGIKHNILRQLVEVGCRVKVLPAATRADEILALEPHGVLLSNGPGDPEPVIYAQETIRLLLGRVPLFGICLGHQLLGLACGGKTFKLPFGHRGANHPVRDLDSGRVEITSQNHGFAVSASTLDGREVVQSHVSLNDDTCEGLRHKRFPAFSVQFHPEASPGPHDSHHLFQRFALLMERGRK